MTYTIQLTVKVVAESEKAAEVLLLEKLDEANFAYTVSSVVEDVEA